MSVNVYNKNQFCGKFTRKLTKAALVGMVLTAPCQCVYKDGLILTVMYLQRLGMKVDIDAQMEEFVLHQIFVNVQKDGLAMIARPQYVVQM